MKYIDTIFCDFPQFSATKLALFLNNNVVIYFFQNLALFWVKNANFFVKFFGENILTIITSVPRGLFNGIHVPNWKVSIEVFGTPFGGNALALIGSSATYICDVKSH
jgi:hypothetical protein